MYEQSVQTAVGSCRSAVLRSMLIGPILFLLTDTAFTQQPPVPDHAINPAAYDEVVIKESGLVQKGKIKSANMAYIVFEKNVLLKTSEHEILFWNGVTNAAEYAHAARPQLENIARTREQYRYDEMDVNQAIKDLETAAKAARVHLKNIKQMTAPEIFNLPEIAALSEEDRTSLQSAQNLLASLLDLEEQLKTVDAERTETSTLRNQLTYVNSSFKAQRYQNLKDECETISQSGAAEKTATEKEFRNAVGRLGKLAQKLDVTSPLLKRLPPGEKLSQAKNDVEDALKLLADPGPFRILGKDVMLRVSDQKQVHIELQRAITDAISLFRPIQFVESTWKELQQEVMTGRIANVETLMQRVDQIEVSLQQKREGLPGDRRKLAEAAVLAGIDQLQREISGSRRLLEFQVDIHLVERTIRDATEPTTEFSASQMAQTFTTRLNDVAEYEQLRSRLQIDERRKLDLILTSLRDAVSIYRVKALQFLLSETEKDLRDIQLAHASLATEVNAEDLFLDDFEHLQLSLTTRSDHLRSRLNDFKDRSAQAQAQAILSKLEATQTAVGQRIKLLKLQQETNLEVAWAEFKDLAPKLVAELTEFGRDTELILQIRRVDVQQLQISTSLQEVDQRVSNAETSAVNLALFDLKADVSNLRMQLEDDRLLKAIPQANQQLTVFERRLEELSKEVVKQRREERSRAGWIALPDGLSAQLPNSSVQLPATPENRWLGIRYLMADGRVEEAERNLLALQQDQSSGVTLQQLQAGLSELALLKAHLLDKEGRAAEARAEFAKLSEDQGPAGTVAAISVHTIDEEIRNSTDKGGVLKRTLIASSFVAVLALICGVMVRTETVAGRLRRTKRLLAQFRLQEQRSRGVAAQRTRQQTAFSLASLSEDHPETGRMYGMPASGPRLWTATPEQVQGSPAQPVPVPAELSQVEFVVSIIGTESGPSEDQLQPVVWWLGTTESRRRNLCRLRERALSWLKRNSEPLKEDLPEVLRRKVTTVVALREEGTRKDPWPVLYELRGLLLLEDWEEALKAALKVRLKLVHRTLASEVVVAVGRCQLELKQWDEAERWLKEVAQKCPSLESAEVRFWLNIANARRASESGQRLKSDDLARFLALMSAD